MLPATALGFVKSVSNESYSILRALKEELENNRTITMLTITMHPAIFTFITTNEYNAILQLEKTYKCKIILVSKEVPQIHTYKIEPK